MKSRHCLILLISFLGSISVSTAVQAQLEVLPAAGITATGATLRWRTTGLPAEPWVVNIKQVGGAAGPFELAVPAVPVDTAGGILSYAVSINRDGLRLAPETQYQFTVTSAIPPVLVGARFFSTLGRGANAIGGGFGVPLGYGGYRDPIAARLEGAGKYLEGAGKLVESEGKYLKLQAEARKTIAEAVDLELDNWKKKVDVYFARREMNEVGKMRLRDLYDIRQDQTLRFKDTAARRRYEYVSRHSGTSGGNPTNLDFLNELFVGTPIGYGASAEELFGADGPIERWRLTPEMLHQLRVRSRNASGVWLEFRLDAPHTNAMEMEWPAFFRDSSFDPIRTHIEGLNAAIVHESDAGAQFAMARELDAAFADLTRHFFRFYGESRDRGRLHRTDPSQYRQLIRAEDFLHQKNREIEVLIENPRAILGVTSNFVPDIHGRDASTLIAWMNSRGMTFAKPRLGEDAAYQQLYTMMHELYALSGAPILDVPYTVVPPPIDINEAAPPEAAEEDQREAEQAD